MRGPISYALNYPARSAHPARSVDLAAIGELTFEAPDLVRFPGLAVALAAGERGGTAPAALIVADDVATARFLAGEISFGAIPAALADAIARFGGQPEPSDLDSLADLESEVRAFTLEWRPA
jgi:1-deoxy-D-xylulose-5-phosphate reductoisomerase